MVPDKPLSQAFCPTPHLHPGTVDELCTLPESLPAKQAELSPEDLSNPDMAGTERKITLLSFSEQAAASCFRYVLLLSSGKKRAGKQPSLAYQMCLVRISCVLKPWHSTQHRQVLLLQLFEFFWLVWREATGTSLPLKLVMCECLAEPRPKFP